MNKKLIIAIDGPAGAGKSTVAKVVAEKLGYTYIDTGAMYRAIAWKCLQENAQCEEEIVAVVCKIKLRIETGNIIFVNDENITGMIRTNEVSSKASIVAGIPAVRDALFDLQRDMGKAGGVVMDGRDIGTQIFPKAEVKIFLTASSLERATRRMKELAERGCAIDLLEIKAEIEARDKSDMERTIAPLVQATDAILLDCSKMAINEVVNNILELVNGKKQLL